MPTNAFLDKGIVLGYCFFVDPQFKKCNDYVHSGSKDFFATKQVEDIYGKKKSELVERHRSAVLRHVAELKSDHAGRLSESDIDDIRSGIDRRDNPSWRFLEDFYEGRQGEHVGEVEKRLRRLVTEIERRAEERKQTLYRSLHGWIRIDSYPDLHGELSELKRDDKEDFYIVLDAHDVAVHLDGEIELATPNPAEL